MKRWIFYILCVTSSANAHTLHIGNSVIELSNVKHTSPGLAVRISDQILYGALYSDTAPQNTLRIKYNNTNYWLGQYCAPGTYAPTGTNTCIPCGIGHYCTGGHARASCTYGAISCNGTNHSTDPTTVATDAPINTFLTLDQVNEFIPTTDFSDWHQVSRCADYLGAAFNDPDSLRGTSHACAHGTIGPGTYLFIARYGPSQYVSEFNDSINGTNAQITNAFIVVFDHPVGYASIHGIDVFQHFVDTEHPEYQDPVISSTPVYGWKKNINATNISNLTDLPNDIKLYVYELK